jgi:hypothetical protein
MKINLKCAEASWRTMHQIFLIMKLTIVILTIAFAQVSAKSFGQLITLHEKNVSVDKVLSLIETQTGYHFVYYDNLDVLKSKTLNINVEKQTIANVLDQCLNGMPVSYKIFKKTIALKETEPLQTEKPIIAVQKISGTVTDDKGAPLPGASVILKDTKKGTVTNAEGQFSIDAKPGDVLVISFIGFQTREIVIGSQSNIEVRMTAFANSLNELVVVGYGTQKKVNLTGAVASIGADKLESRPIVNLGDGLNA